MKIKNSENINESYYDKLSQSYANNLNDDKWCVTQFAYKVSNEYLSDYFSMLDLENKSLATVGSSGDQIFNALYYGSKKITLIDGCVFAEAFIKYKMALIKTFDFKTFSKIVFYDKNIFDWKVYSKISHHLSGEIRQFFDEIMLIQYNFKLEENGIDNEWFQNYLRDCVIHRGINSNFSVFYRDSVAYNYLQKKLIENDFEIEYIHADFSEFPNRLTDKYDYIILSNVYDYISKPKFYHIVNKLYNNNLNKKGAIQYKYYFEVSFKNLPKEITSYKLLKTKKQVVPSDKFRNLKSFAPHFYGSVYFIEK